MPKFASHSERNAFEWTDKLPLDQINETHIQHAYRLNHKSCVSKPVPCKWVHQQQQSVVEVNTVWISFKLCIFFNLSISPFFISFKNRRNCRANPKCIYGLGEKKWLSNKEDDFLTDFENPNDERKKENTNVGLKNLGATCYVNSLLQVRWTIWKHYKWEFSENGTF